MERGSPVSFECLAYTNLANLTLQYEWVYPPELAPVVAVDEQFLVVTEADSNAEMNFMCVVTQEGLISTANATLTIGRFTTHTNVLSTILYV